MQNLQNILNLTTGYFEKNNIESPRLTAELLLCYAFSMTRMQLYINWERPVTEQELAGIREMLKKRVAGTPVQYITGEAFFYGRKFFVSPDCLIPRPETEELIEFFITKRGKSQPATVLEIGTGSGIIPLTLALETTETSLVSIDISEKAIAVATKNAEALAVTTRVQLLCCSVFDNNLRERLGVFDCIISNPPYIPLSVYQSLEKEVKDYEPRSALTDEGDGLSFYKRIAAIAPELLSPGGEVFLEIHSQTGQEIMSIFDPAVYCEHTVKKDISGHDRIFYTRLKEQQ